MNNNDRAHSVHIFISIRKFENLQKLRLTEGHMISAL